MDPSLIALPGLQPVLGRDVWLAAGARLVGAVSVGDESSIWFNAVLRGDIAPVRVGHHSNLQDNCVCHVGTDQPCEVGNYVTVGHAAILHGCRIGDEVLVGMNAVVMSGVVVGDQCIIGASALLTEGMVVPAGSLVYGAPARVVSQLGQTERQKLRSYAEGYCRWAAQYRVAALNPPAKAVAEPR
jgi:carbonic anhydrase/acetyltransferase-like protein (isoleucine patch superfamily)